MIYMIEIYAWQLQLASEEDELYDTIAEAALLIESIMDNHTGLLNNAEFYIYVWKLYKWGCCAVDEDVTEKKGD
jgi:hypothetical protein